MIRIGCATIIAIVFILIAIPAFATHYVPWWGTLLIVFGELMLLIFAGPKLIGYAIRRMAIGMFTTKSRVLRGATVQVHEVTPTHKPVQRVAPMEDELDDDAPRLEGDVPDLIDPEPSEVDEATEVDHARYVRIVFTLKPKPGQSRMTHYEPGELMLIPYDAKVSLDEDPTADDRAGHAYEAWGVEPDGSLVEIDKVVGETRLQVIFSCPTALRGRVKFRYYFESFGDLRLP